MGKYVIGNIVALKKEHPCGTNEWKILRTGVDIKLECIGCHKSVWIKRLDFDRRIRKIKNSAGEWVSIVNYVSEELSLENVSEKFSSK